MICPVCENQVRDGAAFCPMCGTRLDASTGNTSAQQTPAPPVGQPAYTGQYGPTPTNQPNPAQQAGPQASFHGQPTSQTSQPPQKKKIPAPLIAGIATMLAVLAIAGVFLLSTRNKDIIINEKNFPDIAFRAWVNEAVDEDGDGRITQVEARKVVVIQAEKVADIRGIENFTNVEEIYLTDSNLTTFDLSETEFPNLAVIDFSGSENLEEVNLTQAPNLEKAVLTDTAVSIIKLSDPDQAELINLPEGARVEGPDGIAKVPTSGPSEPAAPTNITWFVPVSYRSVFKTETDAFETISTATYNNEGQLVHMEHVNPPDVPGTSGYTELADYTYDDEGRLIRVDVESGASFTYTWNITYDGNTRHATYSSSNGEDDLYIDYIYDDEGYVTACDYYTLGINGYLQGSVTVDYDDEGRIVSVSGNEGGAAFTVNITVSYHDNGRVSGISEMRDNYSVEYTFDDQGRITSCSHSGYQNNDVTYTYDGGKLPASMSYSNGGSLSSTDNSVQVSAPNEYYSNTYEIEYAEITTPVDIAPVMGIGVIDFTYPDQYGDPWIRGMSRPFGTREILQANELWLAQNPPQQEPAAQTSEDESVEPAMPSESSYTCGQMPDGSFVLVGTVHTHQEDVYGNMVDVVSMTLDEPVNYMFEYKGTVAEETAHEVELASGDGERYNQWSAFDGQHIAVCCYNLRLAYHDAIYHRVDSFASEDVYLLE